MKVLVIPEDFRQDQYILKPIIEAIMSAVGKSKAKVRICQEPLLGGALREVGTNRTNHNSLPRCNGSVPLDRGPRRQKRTPPETQ